MSQPSLVVLLVEDSPSLLRFEQHLCEVLGAQQVHTAANGTLALEMFTQFLPDLVLLDLELPDLDGIELIKRFATLNPIATIAVVSGHNSAVLDSAGLLCQQLGLGFAGAVAKPITAEKIAAVFDSARQQPSRRQHSDAVESIDYLKLAQAVERQQFIPYYQAICDARTLKPIAVEILARLHGPGETVLLPMQFLAGLLDIGWIEQVSLHLLEKTLLEWWQWQRLHHSLHISINLPLRHLSDGNLLEQVIYLCDKHHVPLGNLTIELPEHEVIDDMVTALATLTRLRLKQINVAIDDFGAGTWSMNHLKQLPLSQVKFDRSMLQDAVKQTKSRSILDAMLKMCVQLDLLAVAEGVETIEELELLREMGCPQVQGFYIAKPMPAAEFRKWLAQTTATN